MRKIILLISLVHIFINAVDAQTNKTFFLGHSLVNFNMPNMVNKLSINAAKPFTYDANIGNGANLLYHWNNPTTGQGAQWNTTLPLGGYENFIITEAVPLAGHLQWSSTYRIADSLYRFAKLQNPNIQYYIYETWHCTKSGNGSTTGIGGAPCDWDPQSTTPWRQRLNIDLPKWEGIADSINLLHTKPMLVIPAGQALGRLTDSINAGAVPGLTSINNLYSDDIHLDLRGNYFIACVMYAVIHKASPVGLANQLADEWGGLYSLYPTMAQAAKMQQIAWETVCAYPRDGVECNITLPIINNSFGINNIENKEVKLFWKTENETTLDYFLVEKSKDGVNWSTLTKINATSNIINYATIDKLPFAGLNYYRLKQVDKNNNATFSKILITTITTKNKINVYPNPTANILKIEGSDIKNVKLYSIDGKPITSQVKVYTSNNNTVLNVASLPEGIYLLHVNSEVIKVIKK